jgi:hypothetical protein
VLLLLNLVDCGPCGPSVYVAGLRCAPSTSVGCTRLLTGRVRTRIGLLGHAACEFDIELDLVHPEDMAPTPEFLAELAQRNARVRQVPTVADCIAEADVIYIEPVVAAGRGQRGEQQRGQEPLQPFTAGRQPGSLPCGRTTAR